MNLDVNYIIAEYKQRIADLEHEVIMYKAIDKQRADEGKQAPEYPDEKSE